MNLAAVALGFAGGGQQSQTKLKSLAFRQVKVPHRGPVVVDVAFAACSAVGWAAQMMSCTEGVVVGGFKRPPNLRRSAQPQQRSRGSALPPHPPQGVFTTMPR